MTVVSKVSVMLLFLFGEHVLAASSGNNDSSDAVVDSIIAALESRANALDNFEIAFNAKRFSPGEDSKNVSQFEIRFLRKDQFLLGEVAFFDDELDPPKWWRDDVLWLDGIRVRYPREKGGHVIITDDDISSDMEAHWYLNYLGVPYFPKQQTQLHSTLYWLPYGLKNFKTDFKLLEPNSDRQNLIKLVHAPSKDWHDTLIFDKQRSFALVERHVVGTRPNGSPFEEHITMDNFREVKTGVFLPFSVTRTLHGVPVWEANQWDMNNSKPKSKEILQKTTNIVVTDLTVGNLKDDDFKFEFNSGTMIFDSVRGINYRVQQNETYDLEQSAKHVQGLSRRSLNWFTILLLCTNAVVFVILIFFLLKRLQR